MQASEPQLAKAPAKRDAPKPPYKEAAPKTQNKATPSQAEPTTESQKTRDTSIAADPKEDTQDISRDKASSHPTEHPTKP